MIKESAFPPAVALWRQRDERTVTCFEDQECWRETGGQTASSAFSLLLLLLSWS